MIIIPQILKKVNEFSEYFVAFFRNIELSLFRKESIDVRKFSRYNIKS